MEIVESKKTSVIMVILSIAFILLANAYTAQNRMDYEANYLKCHINSKRFNDLTKKEVKFITTKDIGKYTCSKPTYFQIL